MKQALTILWLVWLANCAKAQLEILPPEQPSAVFGGETRAVQITFRNLGERPIKTALKTRLFQLSSATRMPANEAEPWKQLTVLAGQTVLETARVKFSDVRAITKFEVRWFDDADKAVGQTPVTVYPTNLLAQLADLAGEKPPGIFDPHGQLTPLLRALQMEFDDLAQGERIKTWRGTLAILGPFDAKQTPPREMTKRANELARRGVNVLLLPANYERADSAVRAPMLRTVAPGLYRKTLFTRASLAHCPRIKFIPDEFVRRESGLRRRRRFCLARRIEPRRLSLSPANRTQGNS